MQTMVYCLKGEDVSRIMPVDGDAGSSPLPEGLVIPPGKYSERGAAYDLGKEGLYRFFSPLESSAQKIVFSGCEYALLSGLCWIHSHGNRDDRREFGEIKNIALDRKVVMTCGPYSNFSKRLLDEAGVRARTVNVKPLDERNGYDDGHVLIEVFLENRWVLCDIDQHNFFLDGARRLCLAEVSKRVDSGDYGLEKIAASVSLAVSDFRTDGFDYGMKMETTMNTEAGLRRWYARIMRVPVMEGRYFTCGEDHRKRIEELWPGLVFLPENQFNRRFYPGQEITS